jgi:hypothetical protein
MFVSPDRVYEYRTLKPLADNSSFCAKGFAPVVVGCSVEGLAALKLLLKRVLQLWSVGSSIALTCGAKAMACETGGGGYLP